MSDDDLIALVASIARDELRLPAPAGPVTRDTRFGDDLAFDSLDLVELLMIAEDQLGILVDESDAGAVVTVGDLVDLLHRSQEPT